MIINQALIANPGNWVVVGFVLVLSAALLALVRPFSGDNS